MDPIKYTIKATDKSVDRYVVGKVKPDIVLNHLEKFVSLLSGKDVLDIGCGHGRDCKYFEDNNLNSIGIDMSREMLNFARGITKNSILLEMDILHISRIPWKFDGVWSCAVLHHIPRKYILSLLESIYTILRSNGILFLTLKVGNDTGYVYRNDLGVKKFYEDYTDSEIIRYLKSVGFSIIDSSFEQKQYRWFNIYCKKEEKCYNG